MNENVLQDLREGATAALKAAASDRQMLVPVLGAGASIPLGLPSWSDLALSLAKLHRLSEDISSRTNQLAEIRLKVGEANFNRVLQQELTVDSQITTVALQALALTNVDKIITTNLDHAVEQAYTMVRRPLNPAAVFAGSSISEIAAFRDSKETPKLLKLHGSLERPSSWIFTQEQYKQVYIRDGHVRELWAHIGTPFFIGFSLSDADIASALRQAIKWDVKSYAAMPIREVAERRAELADHNVIPIAFDKFEYLPEIIDQVFGCDSIIDSRVEVRSKAGIFIHTGAASIETIGSDAHSASVVAAVQNAIEPRPSRSLVSGETRRETGDKKKYLDLLSLSLSEKPKKSEGDTIDESRVTSLITPLTRFPDVLFDSVIPAILNDWDGNRFFALRHILHLLRGRLRIKYLRYLADQLDAPNWEPRSIRNISRVLALEGVHPAMQNPPGVRRIGQIVVTTYPLTQYQVHDLLGEPCPKGGQAIKPFTIKNWAQVDEILHKLSERDPARRQWRLPDRTEWKALATCCGTEKWPWGAQQLSMRAAHLQFRGRQSVEQGVMEVGCFPEGRTRDGLLDLVGNAYELLADEGKRWLAGWSWATRASEGLEFQVDKLVKWPTKGSNNVSLRPVSSVP